MITTKALAALSGCTISRRPINTQAVGGSQQQQQQTSQQRQRRTGQCSVCLRILSLNAAGVIHQHGPSCAPCAGTNCPPLEDSVSYKQADSDITKSVC